MREVEHRRVRWTCAGAAIIGVDYPHRWRADADDVELNLGHIGLRRVIDQVVVLLPDATGERSVGQRIRDDGSDVDFRTSADDNFHGIARGGHVLADLSGSQSAYAEVMIAIGQVVQTQGGGSGRDISEEIPILVIG